jgi:hypothetical protein
MSSRPSVRSTGTRVRLALRVLMVGPPTAWIEHSPEVLAVVERMNQIEAILNEQSELSAFETRRSLVVAEHSVQASLWGLFGVSAALLLPQTAPWATGIRIVIGVSYILFALMINSWILNLMPSPSFLRLSESTTEEVESQWREDGWRRSGLISRRWTQESTP